MDKEAAKAIVEARIRGILAGGDYESGDIFKVLPDLDPVAEKNADLDDQIVAFKESLDVDNDELEFRLADEKFDGGEFSAPARDAIE